MLAELIKIWEGIPSYSLYSLSTISTTKESGTLSITTLVKAVNSLITSGVMATTKTIAMIRKIIRNPLSFHTYSSSIVAFNNIVKALSRVNIRRNIIRMSHHCHTVEFEPISKERIGRMMLYTLSMRNILPLTSIHKTQRTPSITRSIRYLLFTYCIFYRSSGSARGRLRFPR